jgi:hypothetical protein
LIYVGIPLPGYTGSISDYYSNTRSAWLQSHAFAFFMCQRHSEITLGNTWREVREEGEYQRAESRFIQEIKSIGKRTIVICDTYIFAGG